MTKRGSPVLDKTRSLTSFGHVNSERKEFDSSFIRVIIFLPWVSRFQAKFNSENLWKYHCCGIFL